jgi:SnoaL-like domain
VPDRDHLEIANLIADSHHCVDTFRVDALVDLFAEEIDGLVPVAEFGFATWSGREELRAGYGASLARFEAAMHAITNLRVEVDGDRASARSYVQGWHWLAGVGRPGTARNCDFVLLGVTTDELVRQPIGWRLLRRRLDLIGPGVAVGTLPEFLTGIGAATSS